MTLIEAAMKRIGGIVREGSREGLEIALERLEQSRGRQPRSESPEGPHTAPERAQRGVGGSIRSLAQERTRRRHEQAEQLLALAKSMGVQGEALEIVKRTADQARKSKEDWVFVMISPAQNAVVVEWLSSNSKRPVVAVRLWAQLFAHLRSDTGEITQTRQQLAERLGISAQNLSRVMTELESINAIRREKSGRSVRYYLNANIATHLPHNSRRAAQRKDGPLLRLMERPN